MKLLSAKINNVFSIGDIELDLKDKGLLLVHGHSLDENDPNGSGKSSLAHKAITWGLFGETAIGAKADSVIRKGKKKCQVEITFEGIDRYTYRTLRQRGPNNLILSKYDNNNNIWTDISCKLEKETTQRICHLLGRNFMSWLQSDFFGQGRKLSYAELTPSQQKTILEEILPMNQLEKWEEALIQSKKDIEQQITTYESEIVGFNTTAASLIGVKAQLAVSSEDWEKSHAHTLIMLKASFEQTKKDYNNAAGTIERLGVYLNMHEDITDEKVMGWNLRRNLTEKKITELEKEFQQKKQNTNHWYLMLNKSQQELEQYQNNSTCPYCNSPVTGEYIQAKIKEHDLAVKHADLALKLAHEAHKEIEERFEEAKKELQHTIDEHGRCAEILQNKKAYLNQIENYNKIVKENHPQKYFDMIKEEEKKQNPISKELDAIRTKILQCKSDITDRRLFIKDAKSDLFKVTFWVDKLKIGFKNFLFEHVTEFLNERASYYISELGNPQIKINFSTIKTKADGSYKEDFNVHVSSDTGGGSYNLLSGGEQQLSSFAIGLALADLASSQATGHCNFMVLDEPFTNLGPTNCERLINFIQKILVPRKSTIFLISNETNLQNLIPDQLYVVKENGITRLEEIS